MYVNEVGYSRDLVENVAPREQDRRVVRYFFHTKEPLIPGQEGKLGYYSDATLLISLLCQILLNLNEN